MWCRGGGSKGARDESQSKEGRNMGNTRGGARPWPPRLRMTRHVWWREGTRSKKWR